MHSNYRNNSSGFTLLEVLISMAVMIFIAFAIFQATTETYKLRDALQSEGEFYNGIRMSMDILQRDVAVIYSPTMMLPPKPPLQPGQNPDPADARDMDVIMSSDLGQTTKFWAAATDKTGVRPSRFIGTDTQLSFVALSHIRIYKNSPESEFAKITYGLERDTNSQALEGTSVLIRTESANAFEDDESRDKKSTRTYPLLPGIRKLKYDYYRKDKDRWETSWDSDKEDTKNIFPDKIKVTFEAIGPSRLSFDGVYIFRPEVPINGLDPST